PVAHPPRRAHFRIDEVFAPPSRVRECVPISLLAFPRVVPDGAAETRAVGLARAEVLRDLVVYCVDRHDAGSAQTAEQFALLADLLGRAAPYRLELGADLDRGPQLPRELLTEGDTRDPDEDGTLRGGCAAAAAR